MERTEEEQVECGGVGKKGATKNREKLSIVSMNRHTSPVLCIPPVIPKTRTVISFDPEDYSP